MAALINPPDERTVTPANKTQPGQPVTRNGSARPMRDLVKPPIARIYHTDDRAAVTVDIITPVE